MARGAHWLSGGARRWLDDLAHAWWKRGMLARLRGDHRTSGGGREEALVAEIERRTKSLEAVYLGNFAWMKGPSRDDEAASGGDARDTSHVSRACRVLATHQALSPFFPDTSKMVDIIREHEGAEALASSVLGAGVAAAMMMTRDPTALAVRIVRALAYDHGDRGWAWTEARPGVGVDRGSTGDRRSAEAFAGSAATGIEPGTTGRIGDVGDDDDEAAYAMETSRCLYHSLFAAEGVPGLVAATCCAVDGEAWFSRVPARHGVTVRRTESLGAGDGRCVIRVERRRDARRFVASNGEYQGKGS